MPAINEKFAELGSSSRIWAIAAINGDLGRLETLHDHLAGRFSTSDRLVYLGNYLGATSVHNVAVMDELLAFRAAMLTHEGMEPYDIVHLRGPADEAWQRLLRLQFTPVPAQALENLLECGVEGYLRLYGISVSDARAVTRAGSVAIAHWTGQLRLMQRSVDGHEALACSMRRAAMTSAGEANVLFVPAGFDPRHSLEDQGDGLWYNTSAFANTTMLEETDRYTRVVRGHDAERRGVFTDGAMITLDGGCGRGGPLVCGCFDTNGRLLEIISIGGRGAIESLPINHKDSRASSAASDYKSASSEDYRGETALAG